MEKYIRLEGDDQNGIYGKLRERGNKRLVIHIHGMTHTMNHYLEITSADFFTAKGFDHYRIGLYDRVGDSRTLADSTVSTHMKDIQTVVDFFARKYEKIYISAHSLGGLATFLLNPPGIRAMSLWDPSMDVTHFWNVSKCLTHIPEKKQYYMNYGNVYVIGEKMVEELKNYPDKECLKIARGITKPVQFIIPEESIFNASPHTSPKNYEKAIGGKFDLQYIKSANHTFSNIGNAQILFEKTLKWFETN